MSSLLFVYGTLKRGCSNHRQLADETFVGVARTEPGFTLYNMGNYPALVVQPDDHAGVVGEVWSVSEEGLRKLDRFEGVPEGLYRRAPVPLQTPFAGESIDAYVYAGPVAGRRAIESEWTEM